MLATFNYLSSSPMLKKFVRIFCYMGLFFVAHVSYASVPNDYGSPNFQRTATDIYTSNYVNWCLTGTTSTNKSVKPENVDPNGYSYVTYTGHFQTIHSNSDCDDYLYNNNYETYEGYRLPPPTSWVGDATNGWKIYTITSQNNSLDSVENIKYFDYSGDYGTVEASTTVETYSFGGVTYDVTQYTLPEMDYGYQTWFLNEISIDATNVKFYALIVTDYDLLSDFVYATDAKTYLDNLYFYAPTNYWSSTSTTYMNNDCPICTRIIETSPYHNQILTTGEASFSYTVDYYISQDDFDDAYVSLLKFPAMTVRVSNGVTTESYVHEITTSGNQEFIPIYNNVTENGTYQVTLQITSMYRSEFIGTLVGAFTSAKTYLSETRVFYVGTTTNSTANGDYYMVDPDTGGLIYAAYAGISCSLGLTGILNKEWWSCLLEYLIATLVPNNETAYDSLSVKLDELTYLPPWGYVTYAWSLFGNTDSDVMPSINMSFPEGLPLHGSTLNLDLTTNLNNTVSFLSSSTPETMTENAMDSFLYWWNITWYILFGFWFISELFSSFGASPIRASFEDRKKYKEQDRRDRNEHGRIYDWHDKTNK